MRTLVERLPPGWDATTTGCVEDRDGAVAAWRSRGHITASMA